MWPLITMLGVIVTVFSLQCVTQVADSIVGWVGGGRGPSPKAEADQVAGIPGGGLAVLREVRCQSPYVDVRGQLVSAYPTLMVSCPSSYGDVRGHGQRALRAHAHPHRCDTTWAVPSPHTWCPFTGTRVGQAAVPGPGTCCLDDPELPHLLESEDDLDGLQPPSAQVSDDDGMDWGEFLVLDPANEAHTSDPPRGAASLQPTWMGNSGFLDQHIDEWQEAEAALNLQPAPPRGNKVKSSKGVAALTDNEDFAAGSAPSSIPSGYVFKTGPHGLGLYKDAPVQPSTIVLALDDLIKPSQCTAALMEGLRSAPLPKKRPARRARLPNGARKPKPSRRRKAVASLPAQSQLDQQLCPELGEVATEERWWVRHGLWALETSNANSWQSLQTAILERSKADAIFAQECRIFNALAIKGAENRARKLGWNPVFGEAHQTSAHHGSGGCAVFARKGTGITPIANDLIPAGLRHRLTVTWADMVVKGGVYLISLYPKDSEGMSETNAHLLEVLATVLGTLKGPWIIGGDWNMQPSVISASNWLKIVQGVVFATTMPTCNESTYDYFAVHRSLAHAVVGVQRLQDGGLSPHWPSRLLVRGDAKRFAVRKLVRAVRVDGILPLGPAVPPPSYDEVVGLTREGEDLNSATRLWYTSAREEWSNITGDDAPFKQARFKWAPAVSLSAAPRLGSSTLSHIWRVLARSAEDVIRIFSRQERPLLAWQAVGKHVQDAFKAPRSLCDKRWQEHGATLRAWATSFSSAVTHAVAHGSFAWVCSLAHVADIRAAKLEQDTARVRHSQWKQAVGGAKDDRPTKLAYQWVRAPTGWVKSAVGTSQYSEAIPDEDLVDEFEETLVHKASGGMQAAGIPGGGIGDADEQPDIAPLSDQAAVEEEATAWANLWQVKQPYDQPHFDCSQEHLAPIVPWAIATAAVSFPAGTGLGSDNISPKALARLSQSALAALAALFMAFEKLGEWCEVLDLVLIVLLPKADGGRRPIGLFPTLIRVWMRTRICITRAWEIANSMPSVFGGAGMGAQRAAWQNAFTTEAAALCKDQCASGLLDLVKAFETVPHKILVLLAIDRGYSIVLLRLSLAGYRLKRAIGIEGVFSRCLVATRGITAGSGFATAELKALLLTLMELLHLKWANLLVLKLYVDDLTITVVGLPKVVVVTMIHVIDFVVDYLEGELRMEVSAKKSKLIASSAAIAEAIIQGTASTKVSHARHGKMLGTDAVGGRRRSVRNFRSRLAEFGKKTQRFQQLRKVGVNSPQMVRTAGVPAITYGCDTFGISDTGLYAARSKIAAAASPSAAGKNPVLVLLALDGSAGTLDPAFEAHVAPARQWATAVWENWQPRLQLAEAFAAAAIKLENAASSQWNLVAGPCTALLATLRRINWQMPSATEMVTDRGHSLDLTLDPPIVIAGECRDSVRRWRLWQANRVLPGLIPPTPDAGPAVPSAADRFATALSSTDSLLKGRACKRIAGTVSSLWHPRAKGDLVSAIVGGQWTQARKAEVADWNIADSRCQLCLRATGTIGHRFECSSTRPDGGWPQPPVAADQALIRLGESRGRILRTRGLAALRLPPRPRRQHGEFRWLRQPDDSDSELADAVWYCDGSLLNGRWKELRVTGFGIVVATREGRLLGYGFGWPPSWCATAAAAEAWALQTVISICPFPPAIRTDCQSLLDTARAGTLRATAASKPLARVWRLIADAMGTDVSTLMAGGLLVWLPAHLGHSAIGEVKLSDGSRLTAVDWRANRLVDKLAKIAAGAHAEPESVVDLVDSLDAAAAHAAALLGLVTHAANNHKVTEVDELGNLVTRTKRDSTAKPKQRRTAVAGLAVAPAAAPRAQSVPPRASVPWRPPRKESAAAREQREQRDTTSRRVQEIGDSLRPRAGAPTLAAIQQRIRAKIAGGGGGPSPKADTDLVAGTPGGGLTVMRGMRCQSSCDGLLGQLEPRSE